MNRLWRENAGIILSGWLGLIAMVVMGVFFVIALINNDQATLEVIGPSFILSLTVMLIRFAWYKITGFMPGFREVLILMIACVVVIALLYFVTSRYLLPLL